MSDRPASSRQAVLLSLAVISAVVAVIHFAVSGEHFQEYWAFGVFMLVVAWLQLLWAAGAVLRPARLLLAGGALLNAGVVAVYVVTRTAGDVVGRTPHEVEAVGFGDLLCTVLEAVVAAGCVWLLVAARDSPILHRRLVLSTGATAAVTAVLLSVALVDGGPDTVMTTSDPAPAVAPAAASTTRAVDLATTSPAGDITMPAPGMQMAAGMKMASPMCDATPTAAQRTAAVNLVDTSWRGAGKYQSLAAAKAAGYRPITPTGLPVVHYLNPRYYRATIAGSPVIDPAEPQSLVYANTSKGGVLVAAMYIMSPLGSGTPPQPGGCLTQWHVHTNLCLGRGGVVAETPPACPSGSFNMVTPPMLHVWFVPIPGGPTAVDAPDDQVVQAARQVRAPVNAKA